MSCTLNCSFVLTKGVNSYGGARGLFACADAVGVEAAIGTLDVLARSDDGAGTDDVAASAGTMCWALRPESVSRLRRCKSARRSAAC